MDIEKKVGDVSAETVYLLRHWKETDGSSRFLLQIVRQNGGRRMFCSLAELMAFMADELSVEEAERVSALQD